MCEEPYMGQYIEGVLEYCAIDCNEGLMEPLPSNHESCKCPAGYEYIAHVLFAPPTDDNPTVTAA